MTAGWDGRAHLSKALWIGLAVDERGDGVGEASFASFDFAEWGLEAGGPVLEGLLALSLRWATAARGATSRYDPSIGT
jgi:hypothetical protein